MFNLTLSAQRQIGLNITKSINDKYEQNLLNTNDIVKNAGLFGNRQIKTQNFGIFINTAIPLKANKYITFKIGFDRVEGHEIYSFEHGDVNESFEKTSFDYHNYAVKTIVGYMNIVKYKTLSFFWIPELLVLYTFENDYKEITIEKAYVNNNINADFIYESYEIEVLTAPNLLLGVGGSIGLTCDLYKKIKLIIEASDYLSYSFHLGNSKHSVSTISNSKINGEAGPYSASSENNEVPVSTSKFSFTKILPSIGISMLF